MEIRFCRCHSSRCQLQDKPARLLPACLPALSILRRVRVRNAAPKQAEKVGVCSGDAAFGAGQFSGETRQEVVLPSG